MQWIIKKEYLLFWLRLYEKCIEKKSRQQRNRVPQRYFILLILLLISTASAERLKSNEARLLFPQGVNLKFIKIDGGHDYRVKWGLVNGKCILQAGEHVMNIEDLAYPQKITFTAVEGHTYEFTVNRSEMVCHETQTDSGKEIGPVFYNEYSIKERDEQRIFPMDPNPKAKEDFPPLEIKVQFSDGFTQPATEWIKFYQKPEFPGIKKTALLMIDDEIICERLSGFCEDGSKINIPGFFLIKKKLLFSHYYKTQIFLLPGEYTMQAKLNQNSYHSYQYTSDCSSFNFNFEAGHCYLFKNKIDEYLSFNDKKIKGPVWKPYLQDITDEKQIEWIKEAR